MSKINKKTVPIIALCLALLVCFSVNTHIANAQQNIVLTDANPDTTITTGTTATVYGTAGVNKITLESGGSAKLVNFPGSNIITIKSDSGNFTVSRSGATVRFQGSDNTVLEMPATTTAQKIIFDAGSTSAVNSRTLKINSGKVWLGEQVIDNTPTAITSIEVIGPEIVQLIPTNIDSISVAWLPPSIPSGSDLANSGITSDSAFTYQVHVGTADKFTPSASTLKKEVSGELQASISGLSAGTTYYVLIAANAQTGEIISGKNYWSVKTLEKPIELNPDVPLVKTEDAGLGTAEVSGDQYTFTKSGDETIPQTGSLLVVDSANGSIDGSGTGADGSGSVDGSGGYLRKVESVTDSGGKIVVQTSQGILSEAVTSGSISNSVQLFSPESSDVVQKTRLGSHRGYKLTRSTKPDGSPTTKMEWKNRLLTVEETISPDFVPSDRKGYRSIELLKSDRGANKLTLEANLIFEPKMEINSDWHTEGFFPPVPVIDKGEVITIGKFRADIGAYYQFSSAYNWGTAGSPKKNELLKRTWTQVYTVGGMPVYQEITLTLTAQSWATASAKIDGKAVAFAETEIQVGVRFNPISRKWEPVTSIDFDKGFTAKLTAQGKLEGEVRLVPNIEFKLYKIVGANLSLEPYSHALIQYNIEASLSAPAINHFTNFDYYFGLDCNMNVTLWPIFDDKDPLYSAQLYSNKWYLFDLPVLSFTSTKNGNTYNLKTSVKDGTNNAFKNSSIQWEVYDPDGNRSSLGGGQYDGSTTAEFSPDSSGKHIIILSGYGKLGDWMGEGGRQYTTKTVDVTLSMTTYYRDNDGDGYGDLDVSYQSASQPAGYVTDNTDCDDTKSGVHPNAAEIANDGIDQNCDGKDGSVVIPSGDFTNTLGMSFVEIPAGTFTMGSPDNEAGSYSWEKPQHQVTISKSYYMQTTEITQGQWKAVMGSNPSYFSSCGDNCPVENVSWNDIQTFITKLNGMGQGTYALPTEAQWEYAARAGSTTAFANGGITELYCGYDANLDKMGWYCGNSDVTYQGCYNYSGRCIGTTQAAQKSPNSWGLYDMHGNVWEWCNDWYASYPTVAATDPVGPAAGSSRVFRGGSWGDGAYACRSAFRSVYNPSYRGFNVGFRLVCPQGHQ